MQTNLELVEEESKFTSTGSGSVEKTKLLSVMSMGPIVGPYGTADNTYATADMDPDAPGFTGDITSNMDFRADCIPGYQFIARSTPRSFGYSTGYLTGNGKAPNGFPTGAGISFPSKPQVGDYYLRIDYKPQILYRWDGKLWVRISDNIRTETGWTIENKSQLSGFINDTETIYLNQAEGFIPEKQAISTVLTVRPDNIDPET